MVFGQLFAAAGGEVYRIDRHPTMACHPATPMHEADLRIHLAGQTSLSIGLVDLRAFQAGTVREEFRRLDAAGVLLDGIDGAMLEQAGALIWGLREGSQPVFTIGSSGVTASLIAHWRRIGAIAAEPPRVSSAGVDQILVISGSCSAVTAGQILWAKRQGFACSELDAAALVDGGSHAVATAVRGAVQRLRSGRDTVLYTALGPPSGPTHDKELGVALGLLLYEVVRETGVRRVVLCGGDTSSHAVQQLNLAALTFAGPLAPGAPLCRAHAEGGFDGLELVLKGGQIGPEDFFGIARVGVG
jgi:uncharacterized protein YgbK (DUF1537 family)